MRTQSDRHVRSNPPQPHPSQKKSKRRPPPVNGAATPAEVFHRNLVDAVSNAEDSDENEHYVYSYGGADHPHNHHHQHPHHVPYYNDTTYTHPRQNSIQSHASSASAKRNPLSTNFLTDLFRSSSRRQPESLVDDEETARSHRHRPKLRNYVMDYRPKQQFNASTTWDNHRWYNKRDEPPPIHSLPTTPAALPTRRQRIYPGAYTDGYSSDDEGAPLMMRRSARSRRTDPKRSWPRMLRNVVLGMFIAVLFGILFLFYRATPLTDISVDMGRVLASDKELIFDLRVRARNPNWWTVRVAQADISMFAFSQVVPFSDRDDDPLHQGVDPAEFLGSFFRFDEPLSFAPAFMNGPVMASSQIRIKRPGADTSGNERWARIIRYPYGLVARGVLKYHPFPLSQLYPQSAVICDVARVDPHSGTISDDPDQSYCLKDGKLITR
ncbi:hypothetical protein BCR43DRAFT_445820 [Syncephalastrum racemosum]|uniref:Uncharacterized protein n=1 Tax=Syncephalastrum racemosum TaxID=13706 RepID=A0A1X2H251_SYNRA|nr:hypothetical protein BCR43DRAFT_445820 [Syncephalastrum racemosum]